MWRKEMREALIVWGGWNGHEPEQCARILAKMLEGRDFKVYVENTTEAFADPGIVDMSLIVPIVTMSKIEKEEVENLTAAIRGGVGLAGYHGGMCDAFRESVDYQFMCGGQWVAHPGNVIDYTVEVSKQNDPIMAGIPASFPYRSEQYYMHVDPSNEVLATTTFTGEHAPWIKGVTMPRILLVAWPCVGGVQRPRNANDHRARDAVGGAIVRTSIPRLRIQIHTL
jgi:type 1 glutamine amidotransferase